VLASPEEIDPHDPQLVWLRRYAEQGAAWCEVWSERHQQVDAAMIRLREDCRTASRQEGAARYLEWLFSPEVTDGSDVPFQREAKRFRTTFDALLRSYDEAMVRVDQAAIRHL